MENLSNKLMEDVTVITYTYDWYCPSCKAYNSENWSFLQSTLSCHECNFFIYSEKIIKHAFPRKRKLNYFYSRGVK